MLSRKMKVEKPSKHVTLFFYYHCKMIGNKYTSLLLSYQENFNFMVLLIHLYDCGSTALSCYGCASYHCHSGENRPLFIAISPAKFISYNLCVGLSLPPIYTGIHFLHAVVPSILDRLDTSTFIEIYRDFSLTYEFSARFFPFIIRTEERRL